MMYAIIETGGKQVRVEPGATIQVERLRGDKGDRVQFDHVLLVSDGAETKIGTPYVEGTPVLAKILEHGRAKKIRVIKMKRRKNYRRSYGHRQEYTELEVLGIGNVEQKPEAVAEPEVEEEALDAEVSTED